MSKRPLILAVLAAGLCGPGCMEPPHNNGDGLIGRVHFAGSERLRRESNAAKLKAIAELPETVALRKEVLDKLARAFQECWGKSAAGDAADASAVIRPLLDDLVTAETYIEATGPKGAVEVVIAAKLNEPRTRAWHESLWNLVHRWKLGKASQTTHGKFSGWAVTRSQAPQRIQFFRTPGWVLFGWGPAESPRFNALLDQAGTQGRPVPELKDHWLELQADTPRVASYFPLLAPLQLPPAKLTLRSQGEDVRVEATLTYNRPINLPLEAWHIPTNLVRDPLICFTACRGLKPILERVPVLRELGLKDIPNEYSLWGFSHQFAMTFMAVPSKDVTNNLKRLAQHAESVLKKHEGEVLGNAIWFTNRTQLTWIGLPYAVPMIQAGKVGDQEYFFGQVFPAGVRSNPPPPQLFAQIFGRPELVYYDWEITGERLNHANQLIQLWDILRRRKLPASDSPAQKWLRALRPHLGNTITEIRRVSPRELQLVRRSHLGLTAFELALLARYVEAPGFPMRWEPQPRLERPKPGTKPKQARPAGTTSPRPSSVRPQVQPTRPGSNATPKAPKTATKPPTKPGAKP